MKRVFLISACFVLFFGCQKASNYKTSSQEIRLSIHSEPPSLDPRKPKDTTSCYVIKMCFEGLMRFDQQGNPTPAIIERYHVSDDKKIYTFFLKETFWSDGQPVTAYDFEKTWKTILDPLFPSEFSNELYVIKNAQAAKEKKIPVDDVKVKALSDKELIVELEHPIPYFINLLACHSFYPSPNHITQSHPNWADEAGNYYVGNGPFMLKQWKHNSELILQKNPKYWEANNVKIETLYLNIIEDENTELAMYENGDLDWIGHPFSSLPTDALASISKNKDYHEFTMAGVYFYLFNTKVFPFNNPNIRKAFTIAINRKEITENVTQSGQTVATSLIPPSLRNGKVQKHFFQDGDIELARKHFQRGLQELNLEIKNFPSITLSYNTSSIHHKVAQSIKEQWSRALGVRVNLENKEWKVFLDELRSRKFQIARLGGVAELLDPITFLENYKYADSRTNQSGWHNESFTDLLDLSDETMDPTERLSILEKAEEILMEEMPIAPIFFYRGSYMKKPYIKDVVINEIYDIDFRFAYVEK